MSTTCLQAHSFCQLLLRADSWHVGGLHFDMRVTHSRGSGVYLPVSWKGQLHSPVQLPLSVRPSSCQTMQLSHGPPCCRDFARFRGPPAERNPSDSLQFVLEPGVTECSAAAQPRQAAEHAQRAQTSNQAGAAGETAEAPVGVGLEQAGHGASLRKGSSVQDASSGNTTGSVPALENIVVRKRTRWAPALDGSMQKKQMAAGHVMELIAQCTAAGSGIASQRTGCQQQEHSWQRGGSCRGTKLAECSLLDMLSAPSSTGPGVGLD